jgi:hypothetical protein
MANETFSIRRQVAHSNVRTSTPGWPAEIPANPILCLQTGHIGRSAMEYELRITHHPPNDTRFDDILLQASTLWNQVKTPDLV